METFWVDCDVLYINRGWITYVYMHSSKDEVILKICAFHCMDILAKKRITY